MERRDNVWTGDCVSDAESGNAIKLGERTEDDEVWKPVDIGHKGVFRKIVDEGLIKENTDISLCGSSDEAEESFAVTDDSRGILRISEEDSVLLARDHCLGIIMEAGWRQSIRCDLYM